ncbi:MAG: hypothetical protein U0S50_10895 [Sphingopyxis sp.]|uniref:hypothetical protein n=1 Tax=Sphingopyxis sp. TaxID=1908224 RepID=UPI002ABACF2B|nr:hypothetical protein [Sphingopyxis sp.]MDZ3832313.1 hypothetical protein [Sphingopyxis sp.]
MKTLLMSLLAVATASPPTDAPPSGLEICTPLPGAEHLLGEEGPDFIIVGEAHGTAELPGAFADLVCAFAKKGAPLTVGLEFLPAEQAAIDAYLGSQGDQAARSKLLTSPAWALHDGRSSKAIFALVETLRRIRVVHPDIRVIAFDHPSEQGGTSAAREKGMADLLLAAKQARPDATMLALTGVGHAGKSEWTSLGPPFPAMAQLLPADRTVTLAFDVTGGEIWACRQTAKPPQEECGARAVPARTPQRPRGIHPGSARKGFDATISVGGSFSASPPARDHF